MERYAGQYPGTSLFVRPIYDSSSWTPAALDLAILTDTGCAPSASQTGVDRASVEAVPTVARKFSFARRRARPTPGTRRRNPQEERNPATLDKHCRQGSACSTVMARTATLISDCPSRAHMSGPGAEGNELPHGEQPAQSFSAARARGLTATRTQGRRLLQAMIRPN
jgi:hypothetical protein